MRRVRRAVAVLVAFSLGMLALAQLPGAALENDKGGDPLPVYTNGPNGPQIFIIGDSISANSEQRDISAYINGSLGWKTRIEATPGALVVEQQRWGTFTRARNSVSKAIVVELGTNDIGFINDTMTLAQALQEFAKVFNAVDQALAALGNQCIVWVGLNEQFDNFFGSPNTIYDDKDGSTAFDNHIKDLMRTHANLHYADYGAFVRDNSTFRASLLADGNRIHPSTSDGKVALAQFEAWYSELYC